MTAALLLLFPLFSCLIKFQLTKKKKKGMLENLFKFSRYTSLLFLFSFLFSFLINKYTSLWYILKWNRRLTILDKRLIKKNWDKREGHGLSLVLHCIWPDTIQIYVQNFSHIYITLDPMHKNIGPKPYPIGSMWFCFYFLSCVS